MTYLFIILAFKRWAFFNVLWDWFDFSLFSVLVIVGNEDDFRLKHAFFNASEVISILFFFSI